jgi:hypothetical protein
VCGDASRGFGVSDSASTWSMPLDLSEPEAVELAADLNARYDGHGEHGPEAVRWCSPAVPVAVRR